MKKIWLLLVIFITSNGFCALTIVQTAFRKAPQEVVEQYADAGNAEAQLELAFRYYAGHQVSQDASQAFVWMSKSAAQENSDALELLSQMYAEGIGVPADPQKAESCFIAALVQRPNNSGLKKQFEQRVNEKKTSDGSAEEFLRKCVEAGYPPAFAMLANVLKESRKYDEARALLQKMADKGDSASALRLAEMEAKGLGGLPPNPAAARALFQKAAKQGDTSAQYELARMYEQGAGGAVDPVEAESWYKRAAASGHADAQKRLAELQSVRFPYVLKPFKEIYPKSRPIQKIISVETNDGEYQTVAGKDIPGLLVTYELPPASEAAGFSGIVLAGVELENRKTGTRYWFSHEYLYDGPTYDFLCESDLDLLVDQEFDPNATITKWAVVYGHLLPDGETVAVFDTLEYKTDSLAELFERNRYSQILANKIVAKTLPQVDMGGDMADLGEGSEDSGFNWLSPSDWWDLANPFN